MQFWALPGWYQAMQEKGWTFLAQMRLLFSISPWTPCLSPYWWWCVKSRGEVNIKRDHILEINIRSHSDGSLKKSREGRSGRCVVLCLNYKILNSRFNLTRQRIIIYIFLHRLSKTCICDDPQWNTVMTFERVTGSRGPWVALWTMQCPG